MSGSHTNTFPKLHNAMWPGLVGKGSEGAEPTIDLDTMLNLTAAAQVDGIRFEGVDIFLYDPHINIDISDDNLKAVAGKVADKGFVIGSVVAPVKFDTALRPGLVFLSVHAHDEVATNDLTIDAVDPRSGTSEFKATAIRLEKV
jgi:hypothetical protein